MYGEELWGHWERVNAIMLSWLMNSVSKSLLSGIAFANTAVDVWNHLKERFDRVDGSRTFGLHKYIVSLQQGISSVSVYYTKLKNLWDELEALVPSLYCNCDKSQGILIYLNRQKLYQFLIRLNDSYYQARSQIILMDPLPVINQAYAVIVGDKSQKVMSISILSMGMNYVGLDSVATYSMMGSCSGPSVGSSSGTIQKFKEKHSSGM